MPGARHAASYSANHWLTFTRSVTCPIVPDNEAPCQQQLQLDSARPATWLHVRPGSRQCRLAAFRPGAEEYGFAGERGRVASKLSVCLYDFTTS